MNKYLTAALALGLAVTLGGGVAVAQEVNVSAQTNVRADVKAKVEATKETLKERKASTTANLKVRLEAAKKTRVEAKGQRILEVLKNALERVRDLAVRTEMRINKFEANGAKLDDAKNKLREAKVSWDGAMAKVIALEAELKAAVDSETPGAAFDTFRKNAKAAGESIKAAHAKVVEAIRLVKNAQPAVSATATTTATVTATTSATTGN